MSKPSSPSPSLKGSLAGKPRSVSPTVGTKLMGKLTQGQNGSIKPFMGQVAGGASVAVHGADVVLPVRGPSLMGILAAKRFTNRLVAKIAARKATAALPKEPTYRLEPKYKFQPKKVENIIKNVVDGRLESWKYNPKTSGMLSKVMSEEIKEKVKALNFDRYKYVCIVTIGEKKDQQLRVSSRCQWDTRFDSFSTYNFQTTSFFCTVTVYGLYKE